MKRVGNLYSQIYDLENLKLAHQNAKKKKGWYKEVVEIDKNPEPYLKCLRCRLKYHYYRTSEYTKFTKQDGQKKRDIYKLPYFPDRICHWAVLQVIEPYILKNLITDTYSAIPQRGIHRGLQRVIKGIQEDEKGCQYCLKIDARKYYPSINHQILKQKYRRIFKDKELLMLLDEIIDSISTCPVTDETKPILDKLYQHQKILELEDGSKFLDGVGIPIGNYLSQYNGNFYFSSFDHWIKEEKRVKYYYRYMDDMVFFGRTKEELHELLNDIEVYFRENLKLTVKSNYQIFPTYIRGVDFLGYRIFKDFTLLRKSTCLDMEKKLKRIRKKTESGNMMNYAEWCSISSYHGWLKWCNSFRLEKKYVSPLDDSFREYYQKVVKGDKND